MVKKIRKPTSIKENEHELITKAIELAYKQLSNGTATSQVLVHYLKLGSTLATIEKEKLELENELLKAKTAALDRERESGEAVEAAIAAFRKYSGEFFDE